MATSNPTIIPCNEDSWFPITLTLKDDSGDPVALSTVDSIEMTLTELGGAEIVNSRQKQDVLNANNCTLHATSGLFTWNVQVADTAIVNGNTFVGDVERHLATFTLTWDTNKQLHWWIELAVLNLFSVPQEGA